MAHDPPIVKSVVQLWTGPEQALLDVVHPPAVGTAISFAFRVGAESNLVLFGLALDIMVVLVILEQVTVWQLARWDSSGGASTSRTLNR